MYQSLPAWPNYITLYDVNVRVIWNAHFYTHICAYLSQILQVTEVKEEDLLPLDTPQPLSDEPRLHDSPLHTPSSPPDTARSTLSRWGNVVVCLVHVYSFTCACTSVGLICSVIFGVGEMDIQRDASLSPTSPPHAPPPAPLPLPYLLLDVRHKDDYDQCHIKTGEP